MCICVSVTAEERGADTVSDRGDVDDDTTTTMVLMLFSLSSCDCCSMSDAVSCSGCGKFMYEREGGREGE